LAQAIFAHHFLAWESKGFIRAVALVRVIVCRNVVHTNRE